MTVRCIKCKAKLLIPDEKAGNPRLKLKCPGCGLVFPLGKAPRAGSAGRATAAPSAAAAAGASPTQGSDRATAAAGGAALTGTSLRAAKRNKTWQKCANHPTVETENACQNCYKGYCRECGKHVHSAVICPDCEKICIRTWELDEKVDREVRRARPLRDEVETFIRYPLTDKVAFVMFAILVGFFAYGAAFSLFAYIVQQAFLYWYAFNALAKVANGNFKLSLPEFRDADDFFRPVFLGFAAGLASSYAYLIAIAIGGALIFGAVQLPDSVALAPASAAIEQPAASRDAVPALARNQADDTEWGNPGTSDDDWEDDWDDPVDDDSGPGAGLIAGLAGLSVVVVICWMYKILYTPIALIVAGMSQSVLETLKPHVGLGTIQRMGKMYGEVLLFYGIIVAVEWVCHLALKQIPLVGLFFTGFVHAYAMLCIGCLLGLAVDKKAVELGLE